MSMTALGGAAIIALNGERQRCRRVRRGRRRSARLHAAAQADGVSITTSEIGRRLRNSCRKTRLTSTGGSPAERAATGTTAASSRGILMIKKPRPAAVR